MNITNRRNFIKQSGLLLTSLLVSGESALAAVVKKSSTILLVSGWQDVNIGDIAHTPGLLRVLETYAPQANIILWKKSKATEEVAKLLKNNFPRVQIIYGNVDNNKEVDSPEVRQAFAQADVMIHGSGPSVMAQPHLEAWVKNSAKPFGIYGTTIQNIDENLKKLLSKAAFIYTRETASLKVLEKAGITGNHVGFAPDATFFLNIHNDAKAEQFLRENGLEKKKFICAVPRLRITPYYKNNPSNYTLERIQQIEELNNQKKEPDHAKLREAMVAWVRETGNKVLVCPEMTYQVELMDELLIDPLPADVKPFIVKRGYWLPDEAASVYAQAHTVLSFECHSPIISAANNTPFFYLRQPEDTIKGQMYYDLQFNDRVFEIEETTGTQITNSLREVWKNYDTSCAQLKKSMKNVDNIYKTRTAFVKKFLS